MMKSKGSSETLNLDSDLPTTEQDILALRRARKIPEVDLAGFIRFLAHFDPPQPDLLRKRKGPRGSTRFEL
jgi:hypothetical protein